MAHSGGQTARVNSVATANCEPLGGFIRCCINKFDATRCIWLRNPFCTTRRTRRGQAPAATGFWCTAAAASARPRRGLSFTSVDYRSNDTLMRRYCPDGQVWCQFDDAGRCSEQATGGWLTIPYGAPQSRREPAPAWTALLPGAVFTAIRALINPTHQPDSPNLLVAIAMVCGLPGPGRR